MFPLGAMVQCLHIECSRNLTKHDHREEESQLYLKEPASEKDQTAGSRSKCQEVGTLKWQEDTLCATKADTPQSGTV